MVRISIVAAFAAAAPLVRSSKITPVQKVLDMMGGMKAKGQKAMEDEAKIMATYTEWVSDETTRLGFNIKTANSDIEKLTAFIEKADNDVAQLGQAISELDDLIAQKEGEKQAATDLRNTEHAEYVKVSTDLGESVDALGRAITTLEQEQGATPQAMMLIQKMAKSQQAMRPVLAALMQMDSKEDGAPDVAAYQSQSGGILEMLEGLLKKFKEELADTDAAETSRVQNYDMNMIQLTDLIKNSKANREEKAETKANTAAESAKAKGDLADTKASLAADEKTLAEMTSIFEQKSSVFKQNQEVRKLELEALAKAIEIISNPNVSASYAGHINLAQTNFLQMTSSTRRALIKDKAAALLQKRATALKSQTLMNLASQMKANPFAKVVDMIKELIAKLKEEAAAEADHKAWCDQQLMDNKNKRNKKTTESEKLMAEIDEMNANIDTMAKTIQTLIQEQEDLTKAMGEATTQRTAEKTENEATIADAQAGAAAVKSALVVVRNFYDSQSFIQKQVPEMAAYGGMQAGKGGVVGMLEVIVSDFVRLEAETKSAEAMGAAEYDNFMKDAEADKEYKHKTEVKTKLEKDQEEFEVGRSEKMLVGVNEELAKANDYFEVLKPECIEVKVSYEERVKARQDEIEALKEAYKVLDSKSVE
jgi:hypothetical protein